MNFSLLKLSHSSPLLSHFSLHIDPVQEHSLRYGPDEEGKFFYVGLLWILGVGAL
jgi:hypothetical protein